jgi:acyl transferase domain-containing protein
MATADYWVRQATAPARAAEAVRCVASGREVVFMAMGDDRGSSPLAREAARSVPVVGPVPGRDEPQSDLAAALLALGALWTAGADVRWEALHHGHRRRRVPLPTYPFARTRHWVEPGRPGESAAGALPHGRAGV